MTSSVVVLEFNELCEDLVSGFIKKGLLPNFERMRSQSVTAKTDAEESPPFLEPWIQWVSVHTGLPYSEHKCFELNDGAKLHAPRIWDRVSQAGGKVWICGSMNTGTPSSATRGFILPDPWADATKALPTDFFAPFSKIVRAYVHEHSSGKTGVGIGDFANFARFMAANGLSRKTILHAIRQISGEFRRPIRWQRPALLDSIQWDLFKSIYRKQNPRFATFFINSTAHFQHFHWREMSPNLFSVRPQPEDIKIYGNAIEYGYRKMDIILGEALNLIPPDATLVLCTALSQKPMLTHEDIGGRQIFRHKDHRHLLKFAGIKDNYKYIPVMSQQFKLEFANANDARDAAIKIEDLEIDDGSPLMLARRNGNQIISGSLINRPPRLDAKICRKGSSDTLRFWDHFYPLEALRSGMHDPAGMLWVRTPAGAHHRVERKVPLLEVAPTLHLLTGLDPANLYRRSPMAELRQFLKPLAAAA